ncbi:unnamed protein product [Caenorhabditis angaria]|uniref:F-box domain-containing protein n=1 Tax=Caenorhabditis angaria TaxID=860376 RepID=A0A9P1IH40_9PELO|nr:unnamed protein product [Caenorhabditis angaria]
MELERAQRGSGSSRRAKRLAQQAKTHPMIQAKQNQMYLITTVTHPSSDTSLINKKLPKELILRIFSYLDTKGLCRCAQTCHAWNALALDGSNWKRVDLFTFQKDVKSAVIENLARRCGGFLKELSLKGCENVHDLAIKTFTAKCPNLEYLSLYKCKRVTDTSCENLGKNCHKLKYLNLENCTSITDRSMRFIGDGCKNLEYLNISWCDSIQDRGIQYIINNCTKLETLILRGCDGLTENVFDQNLEQNAEQEGLKLENLTKINLLGCFINDETINNLAVIAKNIEYLCISNCSNITDNALISLGNHSFHLKTLEVAGCNLLGDNGFIPLAKGCRYLEKLDLEDCSLISDASINSLANYCGGLKELSLSHCELLTDESMHNLAAKQRETLEILEVDNCPLLSDSTLSHLRHCKTLKRIDLYDCQNVSKDAIQRFKLQRPHVEIHAYFAPATPPPDAVVNRAGAA